MGNLDTVLGELKRFPTGTKVYHRSASIKGFVVGSALKYYFGRYHLWVQIRDTMNGRIITYESWHLEVDRSHGKD